MDRDLIVNLVMENKDFKRDLSGLLEEAIKSADNAGKDISRGITPDLRGFQRQLSTINQRMGELENSCKKAPKAMIEGSEGLLAKYQLLENMVGEIAKQNKEMYDSFKNSTGNLQSFAKVFNSLDPKKVSDITNALANMVYSSKDVNTNISTVLATISNLFSQGESAAKTIQTVGNSVESTISKQEKSFRGMSQEARDALKYWKELDNLSKNISVGFDDGKIKKTVGDYNTAISQLGKAIEKAKKSNEDFVNVQSVNGKGINFSGNLEDAVQEQAAYAAKIVSISKNNIENSNRTLYESLSGVINEAYGILDKRMAETFSKYYSGASIAKVKVGIEIEKDPNLLEPLNAIIKKLQNGGKINTIKIPVELIEPEMGQLEESSKKKAKEVKYPKDADTLTQEIYDDGNSILKKVDKVRTSVKKIEDKLLEDTKTWKTSFDEQFQIKLGWDSKDTSGAFDNLLYEITSMSEKNPILLELNTDFIVEQIREALNGNKFNIQVVSDNLPIIANVMGIDNKTSPLNVDYNALINALSKANVSIGGINSSNSNSNAQDKEVDSSANIEEKLEETKQEQQRQSKITEEAGKYLDSIYNELVKFVNVQNKKETYSQKNITNAKNRITTLEQDPVKNAEAIKTENDKLIKNQKQFSIAQNTKAKLSGILSIDGDIADTIRSLNSISDPEKQAEQIREFILKIVQSSTLIEKFSSKKNNNLYQLIRNLVQVEDEVKSLKQNNKIDPQYLSQKELELDSRTKTAKDNTAISSQLVDFLKKVFIGQSNLKGLNATTNEAAGRDLNNKAIVKNIGQLAGMGQSAKMVADSIKNGDIPSQENLNTVFEQFSTRAKLTPELIKQIEVSVKGWMDALNKLESELLLLKENPISNSQDIIDKEKQIADLKSNISTGALGKYGDFATTATSAKQYQKAIHDLEDFINSDDGYKVYLDMAKEELKQAKDTRSKVMRQEDSTEEEKLQAQNAVDKANFKTKPINAEEYFEQEVDIAYKQLSDSAKKYIPQLIQGAANESGLSRDEMLGGTSEVLIKKYSDVLDNLNLFRDQKSIVLDLGKQYEIAQNGIVGKIVGLLKNYSLKATYTTKDNKSKEAYINTKDLSGDNKVIASFYKIIQACESILNGTNLNLDIIKTPNNVGITKGDMRQLRRGSNTNTTSVRNIQNSKASDESYDNYVPDAIALGKTNATWEQIITQNKEKQLNLEEKIQQLKNQEMALGIDSAIKKQEELKSNLQETKPIEKIIDTTNLEKSVKDLKEIKGIINLINNSSNDNYQELSSYLDKELKKWRNESSTAPSEKIKDFISVLASDAKSDNAKEVSRWKDKALGIKLDPSEAVGMSNKLLSTYQDTMAIINSSYDKLGKKFSHSETLQKSVDTIDDSLKVVDYIREESKKLLKLVPDTNLGNLKYVNMSNEDLLSNKSIATKSKDDATLKAINEELVLREKLRIYKLSDKELEIAKSNAIASGEKKTINLINNEISIRDKLNKKKIISSDIQRNQIEEELKRLRLIKESNERKMAELEYDLSIAKNAGESYASDQKSGKTVGSLTTGKSDEQLNKARLEESIKWITTLNKDLDLADRKIAEAKNIQKKEKSRLSQYDKNKDQSYDIKSINAKLLEQEAHKYRSSNEYKLYKENKSKELESNITSRQEKFKSDNTNLSEKELFVEFEKIKQEEIVSFRESLNRSIEEHAKSALQFKYTDFAEAAKKQIDEQQLLIDAAQKKKEALLSQKQQAIELSGISEEELYNQIKIREEAKNQVNQGKVLIREEQQKADIIEEQKNLQEEADSNHKNEDIGDLYSNGVKLNGTDLATESTLRKIYTELSGEDLGPVKVNKGIQESRTSSSHPTSTETINTISPEKQLESQISGLLGRRRFIDAINNGEDWASIDSTNKSIRDIVERINTIDPENGLSSFIEEAKQFAPEIAPITEQLQRITSAASVSQDELKNFPETFKLLNSALDEEYKKEAPDLEKVVALKIKLRNLNSQNASALVETGVITKGKNDKGYDNNAYKEYLKNNGLLFSSNYKGFGKTKSTTYALNELAGQNNGIDAKSYFNKLDYVKVFEYIEKNLTDLIDRVIAKTAESPSVSSAKNNQRSFSNSIKDMLSGTSKDSNERMAFFGKEWAFKNSSITGDNGAIAGDQIDTTIKGLVGKAIISAFHTHVDKIESTMSGSDIDRSIYDAFKNKEQQILKQGSLTDTKATYIDWTGIDEKIAENIQTKIKANLSAMVNGTTIVAGNNGYAELGAEFDKLEESAKASLIEKWNGAIRQAFESEGQGSAFKQFDISESSGIEKLRKALIENVVTSINSGVEQTTKDIKSTKKSTKKNSKKTKTTSTDGSQGENIPDNAVSIEEINAVKETLLQQRTLLEEYLKGASDPKQQEEIKGAIESIDEKMSKQEDTKASDDSKSLSGSLRSIVAKDSTLQSILHLIQGGIKTKGTNGDSNDVSDNNANPNLKTYRTKLNSYANKFNKKNFEGYEKVTSGAGSGFTNGAKQLTYTLEKAGEEAKKVTLIFDEYNGEIKSWVTSTKEYEDTSNQAFNSVGKNYEKVGALISNVKIDPNESNMLIDEYMQKVEQLQKVLYTPDGKTGLNGIASPEQNANVTKLTSEVNSLANEITLLAKESSKLQNKGSIVGGSKITDGADINSIKEKMIQLAKSIQGANVSEKDFNESTMTLKYTIEGEKGAVKEVTDSFDQFNNVVIRTEAQGKTIPSFFGSVVGGLKNQLATLLRYYSGSMIIMQVFNQIRQGIEYVKEIDTALTELKKVTNATEESYKSFLKTLSATSAEVGATVSDLTNSAADWARLGYSMQEAGELAKNTAILMNVSEFDNVTDATNSMISALQAYKKEGEDVGTLSMDIINKFNEVGNNYAISTSDLAESLTRSSATLVAAGNSLSESIALTTAANATIQDPDSVGNALKVVSMRLRGTSTKELEEAGEDTDGVVESVSKLNDLVKSLTSMAGKDGITLLKDDGSYKDTYQIMVELSKVYSKMTDKNQAALLEAIAGKTRGSVVSALLQNGDMLENVFNSSENSNGSAQKELNIYLDSIEGRMTQLKNSVQNFWNDFIDSDLIKFIVTLGQHLIDFIDQLGFAKTAMLAFVGVKILPWFLEAITGVNKLGDAFKFLANHSFNKAMPMFELGIKGIKKRFLDLNDFIVGLFAKGGIKKALSSISVLGWVGISIAAIGGLTFAISKAIVTHKEYVKQLEDESKNIQEAQSNIQSLNSELETTQKRIEELENKDSLSFTEQEELDNLKRQNDELERSIALEKEKEKRESKKQAKTLKHVVDTDTNLTGNIVKYYDENGNETNATDAYSHDTGMMKDGYTSETINVLDNKINEYNGLKQKEDEAYEKMKSINKETDAKAYDKANKEYEAAKKKREDLETELGAISDDWATSLDGMSWQTSENGQPLEDWQQQMNEEIQKIEDARDRLNITLGGDNAKKLTLDRIFGDNAFDAIDQFRDKIKGLVDSGDASDVGIKDLINSCPELKTELDAVGLSADDVANYFLKVGTSAETATKAKDIDDILKALSTTLDTITTKYDTLKSAVEQYNETGAISADTLASLVDNDLLQYLDLSNDKLTANTNALELLEQAAIAKANASLQEAMVQDMQNYALGKTAEVSATAQSALANAGIAGYTAGQNAAAGAQGFATLAASVEQANAALDPEHYIKSTDAGIQAIYNTYSKASSLVGKISIAKTSKTNSSSSSGSNPTDFDFIDVYFDNLEKKISEKSAELTTVIDDASKINVKHKLSDEIMDYYRQESASAQKIADYYSQKAADTLSKIPSTYQDAIKNGTISIASISDSSITDLFSKYRSYVDKASEYTQKYWETLENIANKAKEYFDDVKTDYENQFSFNDMFSSQIQNEIDAAEEAGEQISTAYYEALVKNGQGKLSVLEEERVKLLSILQSGDVQYGTDQYYEMAKSLDDVDSAIDSCKKDTIEWVNKINEIKAEQFDKFIEKITDLHDEISNVYDLISDEKKITDEAGNWTKEGVTSLALLIQQMQNAQYAASEIGKEIANLKPSDFASYELYQARLKELTDKQWEEVQASESAKNAITDLNSTRIDAVKDGIQKELDAYQKLIDKKKEALEADKESYDYQKTIAEKQKSISDIQKQLAALAGDSSTSANAKKKQLQSDLYQAKQDLEDTYYQHSVETEEDSLDKSYNALEEEKNAEIEKLEAYLKDTEKLIEDSIVNVLTNADVVLKELNQISNDYGVSLSENLKSPWVSAAEQATLFKNLASSEIQSLMGEDGILNTFNLDGTNYLTTPFSSGADAAKQFESSVSTSLNNVKDGLKSAYDSAVSYNNSIISACNQAIAAYKKVQEQATQPVQAISTSIVPSSGGESGSGSGSGGGGYSGGGTDTTPKKRFKSYGEFMPYSKLKYSDATRYHDSDDDTWYVLVDSAGYYVKAGTGGSGSSTAASMMQRIRYDGWIIPQPYTRYIRQYAKGTLKTKKDENAIVDELGEELIVRPQNGRMTYLEKGTGVIPQDLTARLMDWGQLDPTEVLNRSRPSTGLSYTANNNVELNITYGEVVHIDTVTNDTLPDLQKVIEKAIDNNNKKINQNLKRYTR